MPDAPVKLVDLPAFSTTSDANGAYTLTDVPVGNHTIMSVSTGFGSSQLNVFVRADQTTELDLLVILFTPPPPPATGTITGRTHDSGGASLANIQVKLVDLPAFSTNSNRNGTYKLANVPVGNHKIIALTGSGGSSQLDIFVRANQTSVLDLEVFPFNQDPPGRPGSGQNVPDQGPMENAPPENSRTDSWYLNFGTMKLVHNGNKITGNYHNDFNDASGTIKGTLSGNVFEGTWDNGSKSGSLHWVFSSNGDSFKGNFDGNGSNAWCGAKAGKPFPNGCSYSGTWTVTVAGKNNCAMSLVRTDLTVKGNYCNGKLDGKISYSKNANETILTGSWTAGNTGPFKFYLLGYDALRFQGNWSKNNEWCGRRANISAPKPCLR